MRDRDGVGITIGGSKKLRERNPIGLNHSFDFKQVLQKI
jgi:hypothetical protein